MDAPPPGKSSDRQGFRIPGILLWSIPFIGSFAGAGARFGAGLAAGFEAAGFEAAGFAVDAGRSAGCVAPGDSPGMSIPSWDSAPLGEAAPVPAAAPPVTSAPGNADIIRCRTGSVMTRSRMTGSAIMRR